MNNSMYHFYCLATNTTTIEGWEKDKVATLVRRGKIHEVRKKSILRNSVSLNQFLGQISLR